MHPQFPAILLTVVLSWVLVTLWTRALDAAVVAVGLVPDRLPDAFAIAAVATAVLVLVLEALGVAGSALADTVAGMELTALRVPNPAVEPYLLADLARPAAPAPAATPPRRRSRSAARRRRR
jgi:hypothetical protein